MPFRHARGFLVFQFSIIEHAGGIYTSASCVRRLDCFGVFGRLVSISVLVHDVDRGGIKLRLNMCRLMAASLSVHLTAGADAVGFAGAISSLVGCSRNESGERDTALEIR